jgi:hypothetical protein
MRTAKPGESNGFISMIFPPGGERSGDKRDKISGMIDIAARPAIYCQHKEVGKFHGRHSDSPGFGTVKFPSLGKSPLIN